MLEFFEHHFAKLSHSVLPPVTHTLSRPQNYSTATATATAAPAASFSPANRKWREPDHVRDGSPTIRKQSVAELSI